MAFTKKDLLLLKHILTVIKTKNQINTGDIMLPDNTHYTNKEHSNLLKEIDNELKKN